MTRQAGGQARPANHQMGRVMKLGQHLGGNPAKERDVPEGPEAVQEAVPDLEYTKDRRVGVGFRVRAEPGSSCTRPGGPVSI